MSSDKKTCKIFVCAEGKKCKKRGSKKVVKRMREAVAAHGDALTLKETGCLKLCKTGCSVMIMPDKISYGNVQPGDCAEIAAIHAAGKEPIARLTVTGKKRK